MQGTDTADEARIYRRMNFDWGFEPVHCEDGRWYKHVSPAPSSDAS